jgi:hypothetical protein
MNVVLLNAPAIGSSCHSFDRVLPYGLSILSSNLRKNNHNVRVYDLLTLEDSQTKKLLGQFSKRQIQAGAYQGIETEQHDHLAELLLDGIDFAEVDCVGIGVLSHMQILFALLLAEKIKKKHKIPIVLGGMHVTLYVHLFFKQYQFLDYAITGDGEVPLLNLLSFFQGRMLIKDIAGLWYRENGIVHHNKRNEYQLEQQPCPDFDDFSLDLYRDNHGHLWLPYSTSCGCVHRCQFCVLSRKDNAWQVKSIEKVVNELAFLKKRYGVNRFHFYDPNFNISPKRVLELCAAFIENGLDIIWTAQVQVEGLDEVILKRMKKAGNQTLFWGIESASEAVLQKMNKTYNIQNVGRLLRQSKSLGINNIIFLIINYPQETAQDINKTAQFLKKFAKFILEARIYRLGIGRASLLYKQRRGLGLDLQPIPQNFFFSYGYQWKQDLDKKQAKSLKLQQERLIQIHLRYIVAKRLPFPKNILTALFFYRFQKFVYHYLNRNIKPKIGKYSVADKIVIRLMRFARHYSHHYEDSIRIKESA